MCVCAGCLVSSVFDRCSIELGKQPYVLVMFLAVWSYVRTSRRSIPDGVCITHDTAGFCLFVVRAMRSANQFLRQGSAGQGDSFYLLVVGLSWKSVLQWLYFEFVLYMCSSTFRHCESSFVWLCFGICSTYVCGCILNVMCILYCSSDTLFFSFRPGAAPASSKSCHLPVDYHVKQGEPCLVLPSVCVSAIHEGILRC